MSILIVDDTKSVRSLIEFYLQSDGIEAVRHAESCDEALRLLQSGQAQDTQLVLMDVVMPGGIDGIEACRRIKNDPALSGLPVIIITSDVSDDSLEAAFEAGATDYIEKPLKKRELLARVRAALRLRSEIESRKLREQELLVLTQALEEANKQLNISNNQLQRLSVTDSLTGIANRRYFEEVLEKEVSRARRHGTAVSVIMADIDCFKQYNDLYGHQAGDACLHQAAQAMRRALRRPSDLLARYGGEEFVAVIPGTDLEGASRIGESMREQVSRLGIPHGNSQGRDLVTISLGVACLDESMQGDMAAEQLIRYADQALYRAKNNGRNRLELHDPENETSA